MRIARCATTRVRSSSGAAPQQLKKVADPAVKHLTSDQKQDLIKQLTAEMEQASENPAFEKAAELRDAIAQIEADMAA